MGVYVMRGVYPHAEVFQRRSHKQGQQGGSTSRTFHNTTGRAYKIKGKTKYEKCPAPWIVIVLFRLTFLSPYVMLAESRSLVLYKYLV